jgi:hypothetical protein
MPGVRQTTNGVVQTSGGVAQTVLNEIPDSGDLHARYDATQINASDGDSVSTWGDEAGNGNDLTAGTAATYKTGQINGNAVVRFDGTDDTLDQTWTDITSPVWVFCVATFHNAPATGANEYILSYDSGDRSDLINRAAKNNNWFLLSATFLDSGLTADQNNHIFGYELNGTGSELRIDGTAEATGETADALGGIQVAEYWGGGNNAPVDIGEIMIYDGAPTVSDVEIYLSNKWGITI